MSALVSLLLLGLVASVYCEDTEANVGEVYLKVLGKSGKIMVGRTENVAADPNRITLEMDSLKEVDDSGAEVGKSGSTKHSFNSFASQDFSFSQLQDTTFKGINVKEFSFDTILSGLTSTMKVKMMIFKEEGNFSYANEDQKVYAGVVKLSIELTNWQFCDPSTCTKGGGETGKYIDFTITIKGKGDAAKRSSSEEEDGLESYDFDKGSFRVSNKVEVDGVWEDMVSGYPKFDTQGSKQNFIFRFPNFSNKLYYDPSIDSGCGFISISMVTILLVALATMFTM